jgi:hypothetical protein
VGVPVRCGLWPSAGGIVPPPGPPEVPAVKPVWSFVHRTGLAPGGMIGRSCFTADGAYRWSMGRAWPGLLGEPDRAMVFCCLNPSKAGERTDDASSRRMVGFARREGCTSVGIVNLSAWVSTDPAGLGEPDPAADDINDRFILGEARTAAVVVCGWGAFPATRPWAQARATHVLDLLDAEGIPYHSLGVTAGGYPCHPLRLSRETPLTRWQRPVSTGTRI